MPLQAHLENIRSKPEHVRKRIAFWTSFSLTAVIFVFWLASFTTTFGTARNPTVAATVAKAGSPGESLIAGVGDFFVDIKEMIFGSKKMTYSEVEVTGGKQ